MFRWIGGVLILFLLTGCYGERQGFFLSPQNANSNPYRVIPMKSDSLKSAFYGNLVFSNGSANDRGADQIFAFQSAVHRSNNFGIFQAYYGANLTLGSYQQASFYNFYHPDYSNYTADSSRYIPGSNHFFGTYGFSGGINIVATHQHIRNYRHSEWRILGLETSVQKEFGNYWDFRSKLPDTLANVVFRNNTSTYLGLYTEWLWTNKHHTEFGFKIALGTDLNPGSSYKYYYASYSILPMHTFSLTYHGTRERFTGFIQMNFGTYADNVQLGLSYRLGKK
jgi:hypothetical protein